MKIYVGTVLLDSNNRIFLIKESDENNIGQGKWDLPGGLVKPEESLIDAATREAKEETGYDAEVISLIGCYKSLKGEKSWIYVVFELKSVGQQKNNIDPEVTEGKWFTEEQLMSLSDKEIVHSDMKLVYGVAKEGKGLPLETVKFIKYN